MAIQEQNIVFLAAQVMDDVPEGGGAATGVVVSDGVLNNVFEDISDLDRAYGRFNLRKLFLGVRSLSTDLYGGSKVAITQLPVDSALGYTVFTTKNHFDHRTDAQNKVEAYLYKSSMWPGAISDSLIVGMKQMTIIQRVGTAVPVIGKTLCLTQNEGLSNQTEQYVRVTEVKAVKTTFTDEKGDFERLMVTCTLKDPLRYEFTGQTPNRYDNYSYSGKVKLRSTVVANATNYYGAQKSRTSAAIGDVRIRAKSMFTSLVPSAATETPLINQPMSGQVFSEESAGGGVTVQVAQTAHTRANAVTEESRRFNWIETLSPLPRAGTLSIAFMAQGEWYEITDDGEGKIQGEDDGIGSGTVNYSTGVAAVTFGALPDAGSEVIWTWASAAHYTIKTNDADTRGARLDFTLAKTPIVGTSVTVGFIRNGSPVTATTSSGGAIAGTGVTGTLDLATGKGVLWFTTLPDRETAITISSQYKDPDNPEEPAEKRVTAAITSARTFDFGQAVTAGSATLQVLYSVSGSGGGYYQSAEQGARSLLLKDNGAGSLVVAAGSVLGNPAEDVGGQVAATIDYATGLVTFQALTVPYRYYQYATFPWGWTVEDRAFWPSNGSQAVGVIPLANATTNLSGTPLVLNLNDGHLIIDLTRTLSSPVVAGSARFSVGGYSYTDIGTGVVNVGTLQAGTIDYSTGEVTLTYWPNAASATPTVTSLLLRYGFWATAEACFRSQVAPLKPQSLAISVTAQNGVQLTATADEDGVITGDFVSGTVNYEFGTATLRFGHLVNGVWQDRLVDPSTLRYNAVAYSYVPLDADILGIDPVRLPADGRVPIFRPGDIVMISHTLDNAPVTIEDGGVLSAGRTRLAWVRVIDADGKTVNSELYTLDRPAGTVTFPSVVGLSQPLTLRHAVGDLRMLTDCQISGWLAVSRALTHNYPAGDTIISSCLLFGDRRARVAKVWDQTSWNGVWDDTYTGTGATAQLNLIDFPITTTNDGCDTDRWVLKCTNANASQWELYSENRGKIWAGTWAPMGDDLAPINLRTRTKVDAHTYIGGTPYFVIPGQANGGGWSTGNCIRINTIGAICDFWMARAIQQSDEPENPAAIDGCEIYALGNIDRP